MARGIQVGDKAPDFSLVSQSGERVRLHDRLAGRVVVLYFYPKDETRGCTAEACAFRDSHEVFAEAGAEVIGVSSDSAGRHAASRIIASCRSPCERSRAARCAARCPAVLGLIPDRSPT